VALGQIKQDQGVAEWVCYDRDPADKPWLFTGVWRLSGVPE
jgi:hypothetical protein